MADLLARRAPSRGQILKAGAGRNNALHGVCEFATALLGGKLVCLPKAVREGLWGDLQGRVTFNRGKALGDGAERRRIVGRHLPLEGRRQALHAGAQLDHLGPERLEGLGRRVFGLFLRHGPSLAAKPRPVPSHRAKSWAGLRPWEGRGRSHRAADNSTHSLSVVGAFDNKTPLMLALSPT